MTSMTTAARPGVQAGLPSRGIALILGAVILFVVMDSLGKYLGARYPIWQVVWARYAFHMLLMVPLLASGRVIMRPARPGLQLFRSLMLVSVTSLFYTALQFMPLPVASSIGFLAPLLMTALSMPLLGERVGPRRWAAVVVGFAGVLIVIRPGPDMHPAMLLPLLMAVCYALYQISTRVLSRSDNSLTTLFWTAIGGLVISSAMLPFGNWKTPDAEGWVMLVSLGVIGCVSHMMLIRAYAHAPAAVLAPFTYTQLVWAFPAGWIVFGDVPDAWSLVGGAVIVASGLYVWHRERVRARAAREAAAV
ncbi:DMT family transporter [Arenibaculum sp.]|jgi:drug/metabolite transporter (DMT)-like permease|uniref:DMT family transporter n=1 Tax=Arenibaculum sp. TaxID=2865862 RepID=UPI002E0E2045|nr:DMT family transporter [Arenibaculum sp.]